MYMSMGLRDILVVETLRGVDQGQQVQIDNVQTSNLKRCYRCVCQKVHDSERTI